MQDKVHMEHLVMGLFGKVGGPTEQLFHRVGIDESKLRELIKVAVDVELPKKYEQTRLTAFPPVSRHVRDSLIAARGKAGPLSAAPVRSRHLLFGALSITDCTVVKTLLDRGVSPDAIDLLEDERTTAPSPVAAPPHTGPGMVVPFVPAFPGFAEDIPSDRDHLGFERDVEAFARLLAAKKVVPPLAVGLFGEWGSGKSTFMGLLRARIRQIAAQYYSPGLLYTASFLQGV